MEPKKNPKYDIHRHRAVLLHVGVITSLILVIAAFKWKAVVYGTPHHHFKQHSTDEPVLDDPRITDVKKSNAAKPLKVKPVVLVPTKFVERKDLLSEQESTAYPDQMDSVQMPTPGLEDIPVETVEPDTFILVEIMPQPVEGWATFYKTLAKNIKYPKQAERNRATGKVFVEFTINFKGELGNLRILKGVGYGCDEEALRVLAKTKWHPGKQRGKAVNVRMVQPINFAISFQ